MKNKNKTLSKYKKELDKYFSLFIRHRDKGQCFTCHKKDVPKKMQNGHFIPRQYLSLRWDERNNNCQCYACNMLYNGQPSKYALKLQELYGDEIIKELESKRQQIVKLTPQWYEERISHYQELLKQMNVDY